MDEHSDFNDRKGLLVFFGIVKLFFGAVSFLFFILIFISIIFLQNAPVEGARQYSAGSALPGALMYLALAVILIILGIGSIKKTKWARSLTLLLSWMVFIVGIVCTIFMAFFINDIYYNANPAFSDNPALLFFIKVFMFVFYIVFLIIIPGIFILVYKSSNVIRTVQKYDTKERWTDRCPLPLLALCLFLLYGSILPLFMILAGFVIPFFGTFITGLPAAVLLCINSVICIYLAIQVYKVNIQAWYYSVCLYVFWMVSVFITRIFHDYIEIYKLMDIPSAQLRTIENMGFLKTNKIFILSIMSTLLFLLFLFYTKKFFNSAKSTETEQGPIS